MAARITHGQRQALYLLAALLGFAACAGALVWRGTAADAQPSGFHCRIERPQSHLGPQARECFGSRSSCVDAGEGPAGECYEKRTAWCARYIMINSDNAVICFASDSECADFCAERDCLSACTERALQEVSDAL